MGMPPTSKRLKWLPFLCVSPFLSGCYSQYDDGTTLTIKLALWIRLLTILIPLCGLATLVTLCFLPKKRPTLRLIMRILAIIAMVISFFPVICCSPSASTDSIIVSPVGMKRETGFWFAPTRKEIHWENVTEFDMEPDTRDRPFPGRVWTAHLGDGSTTSIPPGDIGDAAESVVRAKIESLGVKVNYTP